MLCLSRYCESLPRNSVPEANPARWAGIRVFRTIAGFLVTLCIFRISQRTSRTLRSLPVRTAKPFWRVQALASSVHCPSGGLLCRDAPRLRDGRVQQVHGTQLLVDESRLALCFPGLEGALITRFPLLNCEHSQQAAPLSLGVSHSGRRLVSAFTTTPNRGCLFQYRETQPCYLK